VEDEKLGKIDDVIFDHSTADIRYVVVDAGGWLTTKKFLVPANHLRDSSEHENAFSSDLTKERIESFPPYNESDLDSQEQWSQYEGQYRSKWETSPVMHRAETDRNITPTTQQLEGNPSSSRAAGRAMEFDSPGRATTGQSERERADLEAANAPTGRVVPAGTDSVVIENTAVGIGSRWDTFQARLRERRKEAVAACQTCTVGRPSTKALDSADTLKKAV
jgi:hypothetical protein